MRKNIKADTMISIKDRHSVHTCGLMISRSPNFTSVRDFAASVWRERKQSVMSGDGIVDSWRRKMDQSEGGEKFHASIKRNTRVREVGKLEDLDTFVESVDLVLAPMTVGGTAVSSKVFKFLELNVPFVSTSLGMRGFSCDEECRDIFFADKVADALTVGLKPLFDAAQRVKASENERGGASSDE